MTKITGIVFRCKNRAVTADFYAKLGLTLEEHEHGGPLHFSARPVNPGFVLELYKASDQYQSDALMLEVDNLDEAIATAATLGSTPKNNPKAVGDIRFVYFTDPDGRDIMLFEKVSPAPPPADAPA